MADKPECLGSAPGRVEAHVIKHLVLFTPVGEIGRCHACLRGAFLRIPLPEHDEAVWLGVGQRPQKHRLDDAEDDGVGSDPERQSKDRDYGKPGIVPQSPDGVAKVLTHGVRDGLGRLLLTRLGSDAASGERKLAFGHSAG